MHFRNIIFPLFLLTLPSPPPRMMPTAFARGAYTGMPTP